MECFDDFDAMSGRCCDGILPEESFRGWGILKWDRRTLGELADNGLHYLDQNTHISELWVRRSGDRCNDHERGKGE